MQLCNLQQWGQASDPNRGYLEHGGASRKHDVLVEASPYVNGAVLDHCVHRLGYRHCKMIR